MLRVAVELHLASEALQARIELDQRAGRQIVKGQLTFFFGEGRVFSVPANQNAVPAQYWPGFRREKALVLLESAIDAVPGIGRFAVTVGDAVEAIKDAAVMWRMDLRVFIEAIGDDSFAVRRIEVVKDLVSSDAAF